MVESVDCSEIAVWLTQYRDETGLSYRDISAASGVSSSTLFRLCIVKTCSRRTKAALRTFMERRTQIDMIGGAQRNTAPVPQG